jgi:hypothetical protein
MIETEERASLERVAQRFQGNRTFGNVRRIRRT